MVFGRLLSAEVFDAWVKRFQIMVFNDADYAILRSKTGTIDEMVESQREQELSFAPGYLEMMTDWVSLISKRSTL